jgi:biopolymer transport protein ExbD
MITRPLDLAAKLRPEPRNFDWLFYVNGVLLVLFFALFGSRFVLAPALGLEFRLPKAEGANAGASTTTHHINVTNSGVILASSRLTLEQARDWFKAEARTEKAPVLLIVADAGVSAGTIAEIGGAAMAAGFFDVKLAVEEPGSGNRVGGR